MRLAVVVATLALPAVLSQRCYSDQDCSFSPTVNGQVYNFDFAGLCLPSTSGDYYFNDGLGHSYYANVCGNANQICLPQGWLATYETGVAVQMWGSTPSCDRRNPATLKCLEKSTQQPTCCTANCQVLGVMADSSPPTFALTQPNDPNGGVVAKFTGAPPDDDDPFWCPWDPVTGQQYSRTVSMVFACDLQVPGAAVPLLAVQNSSENCDYSLVFATAYGCSDFVPSATATETTSPSKSPSNPPSTTNTPSPTPFMIPQSELAPKLSGGWVFVIVGVCGVSAYIIIGMIVSFKTSGVWEPPHRHFWSTAFSYVDDGVDYVLNCDRRRSGGASASTGLTAGGAAPSSAPSPYAQFGASTSAPSGSAYSTVGGYNAGSSGAAGYSDL